MLISHYLKKLEVSIQDINLPVLSLEERFTIRQGILISLHTLFKISKNNLTSSSDFFLPEKGGLSYEDYNGVSPPPHCPWSGGPHPRWRLLGKRGHFSALILGLRIKKCVFFTSFLPRKSRKRLVRPGYRHYTLGMNIPIH